MPISKEMSDELLKRLEDIQKEVHEIQELLIEHTKEESDK